MADLGGEFNSEYVDDTSDFSPIPAGSYRAVLIKSEWTDTKAGNGRYIALSFKVLEGQHKNRMVFDNLNLENKSEQAVQMARGSLKAICAAVGVLKATDTSQLHNIPLIIKVGCTKRKDTGDIQNTIKGYESTSGGTNPSGGKTSPPIEPKGDADSGDGKTPSWM